MITFKEACEVYHERYTLNAAEVRQNVKMDFECFAKEENWKTKENYHNYLKKMENYNIDRLEKLY